jgi:hypothetical protein
MIETSYSLTENEYIEAQFLYQRKKSKRAQIMRYALIAILAGSFVTILLTAPAANLLTPIAAIPAVFLVMLIFLPLIQRRAFRKRFKTEAVNCTNVEVRLDDDGYHGDVAGVGSGTIRWEAFSMFAESPNVFLLLRGFTFHPIPKRALLPWQQDELKLLVSRHLSADKRNA